MHAVGMIVPTDGNHDGNSDYGSDFTPEEEDILNRLLLQPPPPKPVPSLDLLLADTDHDEHPHVARLSYNARYGSQRRSWKEGKRHISIEIESYANSSTSPKGLTEGRSHEEEPPDASAEQAKNPDPTPQAPDRRSPLERFRAKPRKPLSVSDLVSPSWCELQYWYILTMQYGRKTSTPSMKQGTVMHKKLEDQVHRTVRVKTETNEDRWGLKLWDTIHRLRKLRETGMIRELSVWGFIDGQFVSGVIDELSYIRPNKEPEEALAPTVINKGLPPVQMRTVDSRQKPDRPPEGSRGVLGSPHSLVEQSSRIYISEVKTRGVNRMPYDDSLRSHLVQLMLYHRLLSDIADNKTNPADFFDRYSLRPNFPFSDSLVPQIAAKTNDAYYDAPSESQSDSEETPSSSSAEPESLSMTIPQDLLQLLVSHNSLQQLWPLLTNEIALTMPKGAASIGTELEVRYKYQSEHVDIGSKVFLQDNDTLQAYLNDGMRWWKGEREARGVCVEEAYKCTRCDFAEECDWRKNKIEEATKAHRSRNRNIARTTSVV